MTRGGAGVSTVATTGGVAAGGAGMGAGGGNDEAAAERVTGASMTTWIPLGLPPGFTKTPSGSTRISGEAANSSIVPPAKSVMLTKTGTSPLLVNAAGFVV